MGKLFAIFAAAALLFTLGGPAQAFDFRVQKSLQRGAPTVPSVKPRGYMWLDGYCWDARGSQCQYN